ncbi:conserved hypothetical protein [Burkholderiales bacterium 8X]|nr:conserved hypothetical protein [Burkholderiales bacterium 8X]
MAKKTAALLPSTEDLLHQLGDRLRLARLRRRLTAQQVCERAGMAPMTLRSLERGGSGVTMGAYLAVMQVLGIEKDLDLIGKADPVGRELQDAHLPAHARTQRRAVAEVSPARSTLRKPEQATAPVRLRPVPTGGSQKKRSARNSDQDWIAQSGFADADALAGLIESPAPPKKRQRRSG